MRIPVIPSWCKSLPDTTILYSCDILEFFQYSHNIRKVGCFILGGLLPEPMAINDNRKLNGRKRATKNYWLLGDIRQLRKDMLNEDS